MNKLLLADKSMLMNEKLEKAWVAHKLLLLLVIITIITLIIIFITFMQSIYNYICVTNQVSMVYSVAAALCLQYMLQVMLFPMLNILYFHISTFQRMCAVSIMAVLCSSVMS
jgi:hypothetical protein